MEREAGIDREEEAGKKRQEMDDSMELGYAEYDTIEEAIQNRQWEKVYLPPSQNEWCRSWLVQSLLYVSPFEEGAMEALLRISGEDTDWHFYFIALYPPLSALRYFVETGRLSVNRSDDGILLGRYLLLPDREAEVRYLLAQGACPNLQHADTGNTILMDYVRFQLEEDGPSGAFLEECPFPEVEKRVREFLAMGMDPLLPNKYGLTVVDRVQLLLPSSEKESLLALLSESA